MDNKDDLDKKENIQEGDIRELFEYYKLNPGMRAPKAPMPNIFYRLKDILKKHKLNDKEWK